MNYMIIGLAAYLLGCSNMALYLGKFRGVDLTKGGSGNLGASNAAILLGWRAGILTAVHDVAKALLAVVGGRLLFPQAEYGAVVAGAACVLGHIFPLFMGFRGGKGFAPYLGMTLALNWKFALMILVAVVLVTWLTDYLVVGTTLTVLAVPIYASAAAGSLWPGVILGVVSAVILYKHRENYVRIFRGTEIGLRSTLKGEHRTGQKTK